MLTKIFLDLYLKACTILFTNNRLSESTKNTKSSYKKHQRAAMLLRIYPALVNLRK